MKLEDKEKIIRYKKSELELYEMDIENVSFRLPKSDSEMFDLTIKFNNCVWSYFTDVLNRISIIVYSYKDNNPDNVVACIELQDNEPVQVLGKYNNEITDEKDNEILDRYFDSLKTRMAAKRQNS